RRGGSPISHATNTRPALRQGSHMTHEHHGHGHEPPTSSGACCASKAADPALKDPVCGMSVTAESRHRHEHEGQTYYFCNPRCREKFAADPDKYLVQSGLKDPVCGMKVTPESPHRHEHEGTTYSFCSPRCWEKLATDPDRYLGPKVEEPPAPPGTMYTCPMHPEIRQDHQGTCPKCGMALEPEMPSLEEEENPELTDFRRRFWWTLPLTLAVFMLAMFGHQ